MTKLTNARAWMAIGACVFAVVGASACASRGQRSQTSVMEKAEGVNLSALVLRARVDDLANRLAGRIAETADQLRLSTEDRTVRRNAIMFKSDSIPALYTAAFRVDPLTAAIDVWAFMFQINRFFDDGAAGDFFGAQQAMARAGAASMLADADQTLRTVAARPEDFDRARARVESWAAAHPIEQTFSSRPSAATFMAELDSDDRGAFAAVGAVSETFETLSERLNVYATLLPKQARWQSELLMAQIVSDHDVDLDLLFGDIEMALAEFDAIGAAARRADLFLQDDLPGLIGGTGVSLAEIVAAERKAMLEGVDHERIQILAYLTDERLAVLAALREERTAALAGLREERIAALAEADAIRVRAWTDVSAGMEDVVDYALIRLAVLLLVAMLAAAVLAAIVYRLTLGRRAGSAAL
jgi:hypothetical protein